MSDNQNEQRNPEEIESDIRRTRSQLDETLSELEQKFSPQQLMNDTYSYLRGGGAHTFFNKLGVTVKNNPLPVLVTGVGLGWLIMSQRDPADHVGHSVATRQSPGLDPHRSSTSQSAGHTSSPVSTSAVPPGEPGIRTDTGTGAAHAGYGHAGTVSTGTGTSGTGQSKTGAAKEKARQLGDSAKGTAQSVSDSVSGTAQNVGDSVKGATQSVGDSVKQGAQRMRQGAQHAAGSVASGSQSAMQSVSHGAQSAGAQTSRFIQENPLVAGALGIALGAALGSLFPSTRFEDEHVGEYRDKALDKAAETGQQAADQAQAKVREKTEEAKASADDESHASTTRPGSATPGTSAPLSGTTPSGASTPGTPPRHS